MEILDYNAMKTALARMCACFAAENVPENAVFDSKLVAHELLANALQYGGGRAYFTFERRGDEIRITVRGEREFRPPEKTDRVDVDAERGRGLFLVDALSAERNYSAENGISVVILIR